jgi:catechol 2,3-dioxygenase-like lactoylglutathione lyase family enzyme
MKNLVAVEQLTEAFEQGALSRRELVTALVALLAAAEPSRADVSLAAQGKTLNHVSLAVTDVERSAQFYSTVLGLKVVSRPGNGGINLGLGGGFLGLYKLPNPGTANHFCIGVDDFDPERIAARMRDMGLQPTIDRNPANRTTGGDQLYFNDPDKTRVQLGANGYQG